MSEAKPSDTESWVMVLAGGAGTRFWPASRRMRPKQMLSLAGPTPLLRATVDRVLPLLGNRHQHVLIAGGAHLAEPTRALLPELAEAQLLLEPAARNTAPCIGWTAATVARSNPDAVVVVLPSDHHIADPETFREVLATAIGEARGGRITVIGIQPTHPETGYGYIEVDGAAGPDGGRLTAGQPYDVKRFVEKPNRDKAEAFLAAGNFLWNAGMFVFRAKDMLDAIRTHLPDLAEGLDAFDAAAKSGRDAELAEVAKRFPTLPSTSIDFGVMEHINDLRVVVGDFGWNDVGSWASAWELASRDKDGNAGPDHALFVDAHNNLVVDLRSGPERNGVVALLGVSDLVVVHTDDAALVIPRERAQDVRAVVDELKRAEKPLV